MAINKEAVKLWVEALRSGEYPQTNNALRDKKGYCCLGVLCEVFSQHTEFPLAIHINDDGVVSYDDNTGLLPYRVSKWLGTEDHDPVISIDDNGVLTAVAANDAQRLTFLQIADRLERQYLS